MDLFRAPPVRVQPYFGYRNATQLRISARALRSGKPGFALKGRLQAIRTMLAQFASREVPNLEVTLEIERSDGTRFEHRAVTNSEGFATFDIALEGEWPSPAHTAWEVVALHWSNREGDHCVEGHVLVPGRDANLGVISDIDDTIVETGITGNFRAIMRNWRRVVAQLPEERVAVPGADTFYSAIGGGAVLAKEDAHTGDQIPATHRPFFYVSSSPWNLFSYLVAFKRGRKLPLGPVMLRDWGFNSQTLGHSSHGAHKTNAIQAILDHFPDLRFALIGDDTQGDLVAFGDIVARDPSRIAAVFIRTAGEAFSPEEKAAKATIEATTVPLWLGDDYSTGQQFLTAIGLASDGEAENIVATVENVAKGDDVSSDTPGDQQA